MNKPTALPVRAQQDRTPPAKPKTSSPGEKNSNKAPTSDVTWETVGDDIHLGGQPGQGDNRDRSGLSFPAGDS
jgi:hypothetical protein